MLALPRSEEPRLETEMRLPLYQVDAFTDVPFRGNPAAVVILDHWLEDDVLQAIAAENNLSETAFVIPDTSVAKLRWFTPSIEVDLCGHATLATAHVLFRDLPSCDTIAFDTKSGRLNVSRDGHWLTLDFPARLATPTAFTVELVRALNVTPREVLIVEASKRLVAVLHLDEQVRRLKPDMARVAELDAQGVYVTAAASDVDFVSRVFLPKRGIAEDPVTGAAHCTLVPYWASRLGKTRLTAKQVSARGGDLVCELRGERVAISGKAVDYLRGEISIGV